MDALRATQEFVSARMGEIVGRFKPGSKITVLVRAPGHPDRDFCMTTDDLDEVIEMCRRRKGEG